ncbi:MAG: hypothetical protein JOZ19_02895 [Rubrobacter sp.]|nr:hypothetical protein [Rubrobacter sp.]
MYKVMNTRLFEVSYFAGEEYSIVDVAIYPWVASRERQGQRMEDYPSLKRWYEGVGGAYCSSSGDGGGGEAQASNRGPR